MSKINLIRLILITIICTYFSYLAGRTKDPKLFILALILARLHFLN
jgi:hypothetical protein